MKAFFANAEHNRVGTLLDSAASWVGTPFCPNAKIRGGGVSCQMLAGEIYRECGFFTDELIPEGPMDWGNASTESLIARWVESLPGKFNERNVHDVRYPGDLIGFKLGGCVHHLGVMLTGNKFIHCLPKAGVMLNRIDDATFLKRVSRIWRPVE